VFAKDYPPLSFTPFVVKRNAVGPIDVRFEYASAALEFVCLQARVARVFAKPLDRLIDGIPQLGSLAGQLLFEPGRYLKRDRAH